MKELIRFDEETQRTFLKEVSGEVTCPLPSPMRMGGRGSHPRSMRAAHYLRERGERVQASLGTGQPEP